MAYRSEEDKQVQEWIDVENVDALKTFLTEHPTRLEHIYAIDYLYGASVVRIPVTILQYAVKRKQIEIVKLVLEKGANPNNGGDLQIPPIFWTILDEPMFMALVKGGASLKTRNRYGQTLRQVLKDYDDVPKTVKSIILQGQQTPKPVARNDYAFVEPNQYNIFGEEIEDGTTLAILDPIFRGQYIVAKRANGSQSNAWNKVLQSRKNPWTRKNFDPSNIQMQKVLVGPAVNMNGGKRKTLRKKTLRTKYKHRQ